MCIVLVPRQRKFVRVSVTCIKLKKLSPRFQNEFATTPVKIQLRQQATIVWSEITVTLPRDLPECHCPALLNSRLDQSPCQYSLYVCGPLLPPPEATPPPFLAAKGGVQDTV